MAARITAWPLHRWLRPGSLVTKTALFLWPREQWLIVGSDQRAEEDGKEGRRLVQMGLCDSLVLLIHGSS